MPDSLKTVTARQTHPLDYIFHPCSVAVAGVSKAAPGFAMGYWGEALTYYHPIWEEEDVVKEKAVLDKLQRCTDGAGKHTQAPP